MTVCRCMHYTVCAGTLALISYSDERSGKIQRMNFITALWKNFPSEIEEGHLEECVTKSKTSSLTQAETQEHMSNYNISYFARRAAWPSCRFQKLTATLLLFVACYSLFSDAIMSARVSPPSPSLSLLYVPNIYILWQP